MYKYTGNPTDDHLLPERIRKILPLLPERVARRLRDWLTDRDISTIEAQIDHILGDNTAFQFHPPLTSSPAHIESGPLPGDPWAKAEDRVTRIAGMFKVLTEAGVSEPTAIAIITDEVNVIDSLVRANCGYASIPVAGMHIHTLHAAGVEVPLVDDDGIPFTPVAGWPPQPIK